MTMFTPNTYNSLSELRDASILEAHSDTVFQGLDVFGYFEGNAYSVEYVYDEVSDANYAIAGDCIDEEPVVTPTTPRKYTISHVATCCTDYWRGHHLPNFSITVTGGSTYKDIKDAMLDWQTTDHLDRELFRDSEDYNNFRDAVEELFDGLDLDKVFDARLDTPQTEEEWDYWDCCAFFVVEMEEEGDE